MAASNAVWGVEIGQVALKALKLRRVDGEVQVDAFDVIEHPTVLSQPDADRDELIRAALEQFMGRNDLEGCSIAVSVPGQSSFTRFVKLPPVEPRKVPEIVRFEAEQQIPFPINDVIWRWQVFQSDDSPDLELGIFAMKKNDVARALAHFEAVGLQVDVVQMAPLALYNFMTFDEQVADEGATLLVDVGADKTDLVVSDGSHIWTRTVQLGGNSFTEALVRGFKLSFPQAEKLKRTAASSKYAKQVFQTMRPVFSDLVQEIQRSIGYYMSNRREARFRRVIGLGNGFRLPGLQKFLEQNLNVPVTRIDSYNGVRLGDDVNAPAFSEECLGLAVAYGLALQGLGESEIVTNLLPDEVTSTRRWTRKRPWFAAAAAVLLVALIIPLMSARARSADLQSTQPTFERTKTAVAQHQRQMAEFDRIRQASGDELVAALRNLEPLEGRAFWPEAYYMIFTGLARTMTDQERYERMLRAPLDARQALREELQQRPRNQRRLFFLHEFDTEMVGDVEAVTFEQIRDNLRARMRVAGTGPTGSPMTSRPQPQQEVDLGAGEPRRGVIVYVTGYTPLGEQSANAINNQLRRSMDAIHEQLETVQWRQPAGSQLRLMAFQATRRAEGQQSSTGRTANNRRAAFYEDPEMGPWQGATAEPQGPRLPDPIFPDEDMSDDTFIGFALVLEFRQPRAPQADTPGQ